ncbi:hypothetical protein DPMN_123033, partial [Dreissena polymorpha]
DSQFKSQRRERWSEEGCIGVLHNFACKQIDIGAAEGVGMGGDDGEVISICRNLYFVAGDTIIGSMWCDGLTDRQTDTQRANHKSPPVKP